MGSLNLPEHGIVYIDSIAIEHYWSPAGLPVRHSCALPFRIVRPPSLWPMHWRPRPCLLCFWRAIDQPQANARMLASFLLPVSTVRTINQGVGNEYCIRWHGS